MRFFPLLFALIIFIAFSGFASASWLSSTWHEVTHEVKEVKHEVKEDTKTDWHFTYQHVTQSKHQTFDSARCGTYYWNVQDRSHCYGEWKEKGIIIKGW